MKKVALITGASRGLGFEAAKQLSEKGYDVILTARDETKGKQAAEKLKGQAGGVKFHELDVTSEESIHALKKFVTKEYGHLDVLINNAGIMADAEDDADMNTMKATIDTLRMALETNTFGPFFMCQAFLPLMIKNNYGRVVNVSSGMGQLEDMNGGYPAYRISKTALNAVTRLYADEAKGKNILVNSVCPGWVKTDMGGPNAERTVEEGADTIVWLAMLADGSASGGFYRDREPISW